MTNLTDKFSKALLGWTIIEVRPNQHSEGGVVLICIKDNVVRRVDVDYGIYGPFPTVRKLFQGDTHTVMDPNVAELVHSVNAHWSKHCDMPDHNSQYEPITVLPADLVGVRCHKTGAGWVAPRTVAEPPTGSAWGRDDKTWLRAIELLNQGEFLLLDPDEFEDLP